MRYTISILSAFVCFSVTVGACGSGDGPSADPVSDPEEQALSKVTFDLDRLNDDGLVGPPNGLRSLMYEFCIPSDSASARDVAAIEHLSALDYVERIDESFAE